MEQCLLALDIATKAIAEVCNFTIANGDCHQSIKEIHVNLITWVAKPHPSSLWFGPLNLWLKESKGTRKFVQVNDLKATKLLGPTNLLTFDFAPTT